MSSLAPEPIQAGSPHKAGFSHLILRRTPEIPGLKLRVLVIGSATMTEHPLQKCCGPPAPEELQTLQISDESQMPSTHNFTRLQSCLLEML